jgi:hypothetical protein
MNANNHDKGSLLEKPSLPTAADTLRVEYRFVLSGGGEQPIILNGSTEFPLALRQEFIHATQHAFPSFFENVIQNTILIAANVFLQGRYQRLRNSMVTERNAHLEEEIESSKAKDDVLMHFAAPTPPPADPISTAPAPEAPKMPLYSDILRVPATMVPKIVNPAVKNQPKPQPPSRGRGIALPGHEAEKMAA